MNKPIDKVNHLKSISITSLYLEFCCASLSLATFNKKLPFAKLMPFGDALSLVVLMLPDTPPFDVIK